MGSNTSKVNTEITCEQNEEVNVCRNPDPRSPTPEISRTPLQSKTGNKHNITKNVDLRKTFENAQNDEKLIHNNPILSAVIKNHLQSYDPRSPTQDFDRTPIIISTNTDDDTMHDDRRVIRLQSDCCSSPDLGDRQDNMYCSVEAHEINHEFIAPKNLCNSFLNMTINEAIKENEEPLGSSTASKETIENIISSINSEVKPTQLLETNFDYIDDPNEKFEDSEENIKIDELDITKDSIKNIPIFKILEHDPRSPSIGIDRTPIVVPNIVGDDSSDGNVEDMSDDTLIKVLQNTNMELRQTSVKSQDKNEEGLLIYEDDNVVLNDTPKKCKSTSNTGSRTPLSCMKNKADAEHIRSKSANMMYDPVIQKYIPSKIPKRVSHIPRLKSLAKQSNLLQTGSSISLKTLAKNSSVSGDCENTPPNSHRDLWDKNSSIVL